MNRTLHTTSAILFYVLGGTFFLSYLFIRNDIGGDAPQWWMQVADLPLLLTAMIYGGTSLYRSLLPGEKSSVALGLIIAIPLLAIFLGLTVLNFWPLIAPTFGF